MGEFASKGVGTAALTTGIIGTAGVALAALNGNNCGNGGLLGNLFGGGNNNCHVTKDELAYALQTDRTLAAKDAEIAMLKADQSTDGKILDLYRYTEGQLKERDTVLTATLIEEGKQQERINCLRKDVDQLQAITAAQNVELADGRVREAELNGRVNTLAVTSRDRADAFQREFNAALGCEIDARKAADQAIYDWTACNFARNKKVIPAEDICPSVVTSKDVVNYYLAGNTAQTPAATGGTCCVSNGVSGKNTNTK